jgi:hypothetical protein
MVLAVVRTPPAPDERALREGIAAVIRDRLPTNAVVATDYGSYFWLVTGRRVLHPVPPNDPVGLLYPPDRQALRLGIGLSPGHSAAVGALVQREVLDYYRAAGVTHLALRSRQRPREAALQDLALRERGSFRTVAREPLFTMYSFTPR